MTYEPQSTPSPVRSRVAFSPEYAKTLPGILKIVEIVSRSPPSNTLLFYVTMHDYVIACSGVARLERARVQ